MSDHPTTHIQAIALGIEVILRRRGEPREVEAILAAHEIKGGRREEALAAIDFLVADRRARYLLIGPIGATPAIEAASD